VSWSFLQHVGDGSWVGPQEVEQEGREEFDDALFRRCGEHVGSQTNDGKHGVQVLVKERRPLSIVSSVALQPDDLLIGVANAIDADQFGCVFINLRVLKLPIGDTQVRDQPNRERLAQYAGAARRLH